MVRAAIALVCVAALAAAETFSDDGGEFYVDLPEAWRGERATAGKDKLALDVTAGGHAATLRLHTIDGGYVTPVAQAQADKDRVMKAERATSWSLGDAPLTHVVMEGDDRVSVIAYRRRACRHLLVTLECEAAAWPSLRDGFFEAAASVRTTLGRWPATPAGYKLRKKDGFHYLVASGVKPAHLKSLQRMIKQAQKDFAAFHGPVARPEHEPLLVFVHANKRDAASVCEPAAATKFGHYGDPYTRRFFSVPVAQQGGESHAQLAWKAYELFFCEKYGGPEPRWALLGECQLAWMAVITGKKSPAVQAAWHDKFKGPETLLNRLAPLLKKDRRKFTDEGYAYVLVFRHGPAKLRKAYKAFLAALEATGSPEDALRQHLHGLDLPALQETARRFLATKAKPTR